jgi:hypothetical protein
MILVVLVCKNELKELVKMFGSLALNNRGGIMGDLVVNSSLTAARNSKTTPMVSIEIVSGDDPEIEHYLEDMMWPKNQDTYKTSRSR